jgi:hypothetical protein
MVKPMPFPVHAVSAPALQSITSRDALQECDTLYRIGLYF